MPRTKSETTLPLFERLHSAHKLLICVIIAVAIYFIVNVEPLDELTHVMMAWDVFSVCMIVMSWITFSTTISHHYT